MSVTIPRPELLVLEPPSPYRNPTVETPQPKPKQFYFGERNPGVNSSVAENALLSESGNPDGASSGIEVINFGLV